MENTSDRSRVKAVDTTLDIIQSLHQAGSASIDEVADEVGIGTSTAHRHLTTLHERGYIVREGNEYELSLRFLTHGGRRRETLPANELIHRKVRQLSEETSERVQFITEEHGERVYMYTHAGPDAVKTDATIGKRGPLHVSAAGKAILANLPANRRDQILDGIAVPETSEREALDSELETVRDRGYAFNDEESTSGLRAVGVPIRHRSDTVLGAISVSGPANRLTGDYFREELPNLLLGTVNEIELNIEYS
jgi:DNA-binding IclR family transcriptional regulator